MTVLEKMQELKRKEYTDIWVKEKNGYENLYGLYGHSSIENPDYIKMHKEIFNKNVKETYTIKKKIAIIVY